VLQVIMVQHIFRFRINYRYLLTLVLFILGVFLFNLISKYVPITLSHDPRHISWMINFTAVLVLSMGLAAGLKLLSIKSIKRILREEQ
jgi:hypothetical protein